MAIKPEQTGDWELKVTMSHWTRKDHGTHSEFMVFQGWNVSSAWLGLMTPVRTGDCKQSPRRRRQPAWGVQFRPGAEGWGESPAQRSPCRPLPPQKGDPGPALDLARVPLLTCVKGMQVRTSHGEGDTR